MPGEPPAVSPKVIVMASPSRRQPPRTPTVRHLNQGRAWPCEWYSSVSGVWLSATAVT